jgi:hypothetical protein
MMGRKEKEEREGGRREGWREEGKEERKGGPSKKYWIL